MAGKRRTGMAALLATALLGALLPSITVTPATADDELSSPEQLLAYLSAHRDDVALVSYTAGAGGLPDTADPIIALNAGHRMPLASTIKVVLLAGYASEVAAGRMDPEEPVPLRDWDRFYLPFTDGGAHPAALQELAIETDPAGFAANPGLTVPLDRIVRAMIRWSDNAAADLLLERLGEGVVQEAIRQAGMTGQDEPLPILGIFLSWSNHEDGPLTAERAEALLEMTGEQYEALVRALTARYQDESWRGRQIAWFAQQEETPYPLLSAVSNRLFPRGTAADYGRIMGAVVTGAYGSLEASATMRRHLEWPPGDAREPGGLHGIRHQGRIAPRRAHGGHFPGPAAG